MANDSLIALQSFEPKTHDESDVGPRRTLPKGPRARLVYRGKDGKVQRSLGFAQPFGRELDSA
jgi:hypothetical protein